MDELAIFGQLSYGNALSLHEQFVAFSAKRVEEIVDALATGDAGTVRFAAARLKGACHQVGAFSAETSSTLLSLEACRRDESHDALQQAFSLLLVELDAFERKSAEALTAWKRTERVRRRLVSAMMS